MEYPNYFLTGSKMTYIFDRYMSQQNDSGNCQNAGIDGIMMAYASEMPALQGVLGGVFP